MSTPDQTSESSRFLLDLPALRQAAAEGGIVFSFGFCERRRREVQIGVHRVTVQMDFSPAARDLALLGVRLKVTSPTVVLQCPQAGHWVATGPGDWLFRCSDGRILLWLVAPPTARSGNEDGAIVRESPCPLVPTDQFPPRALVFEVPSSDQWVDFTWIEFRGNETVEPHLLESGALTEHPEVRDDGLRRNGLVDNTWRCWVMGQVFAPWAPAAPGLPRRPSICTAYLLQQRALLLHRATGWAFPVWLADLLMAAAACQAPGYSDLFELAAALDLLQSREAHRTNSGLHESLTQTVCALSTALKRAHDPVAIWTARAALARLHRHQPELEVPDVGQHLEHGSFPPVTVEDAARIVRQSRWFARAGSGAAPISAVEWASRQWLRALWRALGAVRGPCCWPDGCLQWDPGILRDWGTETVVAHARALSVLLWGAESGLDVRVLPLASAIEWVAELPRAERLAAASGALASTLAVGLCAYDASPALVERLLTCACRTGGYSDVLLFPFGRNVPARVARQAGVVFDPAGTRLFLMGRETPDTQRCFCVNLSSDPQAVEIDERILRGVFMPNGSGVDTTPVIALSPHTGLVIQLDRSAFRAQP